jgi:hypothetical protein
LAYKDTFCCSEGWTFTNDFVDIFENFSFSCISKWKPKDDLDFNSLNTEKPNVDEREFTMGFYMHIIDVLNIFKGIP